MNYSPLLTVKDAPAMFKLKIRPSFHLSWTRCDWENAFRFKETFCLYARGKGGNKNNLATISYLVFPRCSPTPL
jgi:hypothetical protein